MQVLEDGRLVNDGSVLYQGQGHGVGAGLLSPPIRTSRLDPGFWQPYVDSRTGRVLVELRTGKWVRNKQGVMVPEVKPRYVSEIRARGIDNPVWNAASLKKDQWIELQGSVIKAARTRLQLWDFLMRRAGKSGFNGWKKLTYEYQAMSDPGEAVVDMDALTDGRTDRPQLNLLSVPLPITHSDFYFSDREVEVSEGDLDAAMAEAAARRCAETVEQTAIGLVTGVQFGPTSVTDTRYTGTSAVYGLTNFPYRITKTDLTTPTGTNPEAVVDDVLEMVETMQSYGFYGPYVLFHSTPYSRWLNSDYFRTGSTSAVRSLRARLLETGDLISIQRLDQLTSGYQLILAQIDTEYMQALNGMDMTTVMWSSQGGMRHNWKVMCIWVPLLKTQYSGVSPILHATTS